MRKLILMVYCLSGLLMNTAVANVLRAGFEKKEYTDLLKISGQFMDSTFKFKPAAPENYTHLRRSLITGMDNRWDLWMRNDGVMVISVRGTTRNSISWIENFYAAMVPAKGEITIDSNFTFTYALAENPRAAVHVGWLIGMACLSKDVLPQIDSCYAAGVRDIIVSGHSQGGAISFLLTAYLRSLQKTNRIAADVRIKTYCSAGPKPGNLYFACDYEESTAGGWAFNVINSADWVPETPMSVQTVDDINITNPFVGMNDALKQTGFKTRVAVKYMYNKMSKPTQKAQKRYEKYLGRMVSKYVRKALPGYKAPVYVHSMYYVRTGNTIVLLANDDYYAKFPDSRENVFIHHMFDPYLYLTEKLP
jgi:hypothetical protein